MAAKKVKNTITEEVKEKEVKVSVNKMDAFYEATKLKDKATISIETLSEPIEVEVKTRLTTVQEKITLVNTISNEVFRDGFYVPAMKEFAFRYHIIEYFTDIRLPENADKCNELLYGTDLYNFVRFEIDPVLYSEIHNAVDEKIEFEKQRMLKASSLDGLIEDIRGIVAKIDENFDFNSLKDMLPMLGKMGNMNEKELVKAYFESKNTKSKTKSKKKISEVKTESDNIS